MGKLIIFWFVTIDIVAVLNSVFQDVIRKNQIRHGDQMLSGHGILFWIFCLVPWFLFMAWLFCLIFRNIWKTRGAQIPASSQKD